MPNLENENELKTLVRQVCKPVKASPTFKQAVFRQILQEVAETQPGYVRIFGLRTSAWVALGAGIAVCMIIYGIVAVPNPSDSVVINSVPVVPQSLFLRPLG